MEIMQRIGRVGNYAKDSPFSSKLYFGNPFTAITVLFLVNSKVLPVVTGSAVLIVFAIDVDLLLFVGGSIFLAGQLGGKGRVSLFVTFPSDAIGSWR